MRYLPLLALLSLPAYAEWEPVEPVSPEYRVPGVSVPVPPRNASCAPGDRTCADPQFPNQGSWQVPAQPIKPISPGYEWPIYADEEKE